MNENLIKALLDCRVCGHDCACCDSNQEICCGSTDDLIDATADYVELLSAQLAALQAENAEKGKEITRVVNEQLKLMDRAKLAEATLSRVEAERDAANRYLEKIDGMFGTAYPNEILAVLEEWRGAQGEA